MYGTNRARTYDPLLVRQMLSQLSYDPIFHLPQDKPFVSCNINILATANHFAIIKLDSILCQVFF